VENNMAKMPDGFISADDAKMDEYLFRCPTCGGQAQMDICTLLEAGNPICTEPDECEIKEEEMDLVGVKKNA